MSIKMMRIITVGAMLLLAFNHQPRTIVESKPVTAINEHSQYSPFEPPLGLQQNDPIRATHFHFDQKMDPFMQLHKFNSTTDENSNNITCNDGSPAGYYKRLNNHSKSWIIYLQGGGFCGGEEACQHRWLSSPHLMSSNYWPRLKSVDGILSSEPKDNPYLWNANHIYVPYCSSDSWTGLQEARADRSSFAFMGSKIIEKVLHSLFEDLPRESSLYESKFILLAGDSAGATGVILNLDKVNRLVQQKFNTTSTSSSSSSNGNSQVGNSTNCNQENLSNCDQPKQVPPVLRGLADSGWFLDNEPYDYNSPSAGTASLSQQESNIFGIGPGGANQMNDQIVDCDKQRCTPLQSIRQAMLYWNGQVPVACASRHLNEPWHCYFAYRAYQTLRTPLFVVQWLYDEAQLMVDNIIRPGTIGQWNYVSKLANEMRASLENVTALFAPSCFSHSLIVKQSWNQININGFKLPHVLKSWEEEILINQPSLEQLNHDQELTIVAAADAAAAAAARQIVVASSDLVAATIGRGESLYDKVYRASSTNFELRSFGQSRPNHSNGNQAAQTMTTPQTNPRPKGRKKKRNNNNNGNNNNNNNNNNQHTSSINNNRIIVGPSTNRLSRSTSIDDATLILNNSVPDVLVIAASKQQESAEKFRLIDTCGWPQCNRDCPFLDQDINPTRSMLPYR